MGRNYKNSPIIEAVCEFRFSPETQWDIAIPGMLFGKIEEKFPERKQHLAQEIGFVQEENKIKQQIRTEQKVRFFSKDEPSLFAQVGHLNLSVSFLKPYTSWTSFKPNIQYVLDDLMGILGNPKLQRIGLRYINGITIPGLVQDLATYFEFRPCVGPALSQKFKSFLVGCELPFHEDRDVCRIQLAEAVAPGTTASSYVLDIDYSISGLDDQALQPIAWIEEAHDAIESVFEGCITDRTRILFDEVK
jgi:uncharacterized protein (TIGR04255 family)